MSVFAPPTGTGRLRLRAFSAADVEELHALDRARWTTAARRAGVQ
jgi:hypothetical protein